MDEFDDQTEFEKSSGRNNINEYYNSILLTQCFEVNGQLIQNLKYYRLGGENITSAGKIFQNLEFLGTKERRK